MKELDKIIKDKLINYEEDPSPEFWRRLNARLTRPRIINGILFFMVLMAGMIFWLIMPKLDAEIVAEQTPTTIYDIQKTDNEKEIEKKLENISSNEKILDTSDERLALNGVQENNKIETELYIQPSSTQEFNVRADIINDLVVQSYEREIEYMAAINLMESISMTDVLDESKTQFVLKDKDQDFGLSSSKGEGFGWNNFSLSLELGRNVSWKSLSSDSQYQEFKNYREANEGVVNNTVFGMKFNYHLKNWVLSTGLNYTTIGEKINYNINEMVIDPDGGTYLIDTLWTTIYTPESGWINMIVGYDKTYEEAYKNVNYDICNINRYSYFEIPLLIGYNFKIRNFGIRPSIGVSIGLLYSASGKLPTIDPNGFSSINENSLYLRPVVSNLIFDINFEYHMNENYGLFIKPFYNMGLNSVYQNYPLSGKYHNAGIKIGLSVYL